MQKISLVKALVRHKGKYLLLQKAEDRFFPENIGKWECPGGIIKEKEKPLEAITRELKEETGLEFKVVKQLPTLRMIYGDYDSNCSVYLIEANSESVKLSSEHSHSRWLKPEAVKNMHLALYAGLLLEFFNNPQTYLA